MQKKFLYKLIQTVATYNGSGIWWVYSWRVIWQKRKTVQNENRSSISFIQLKLWRTWIVAPSFHLTSVIMTSCNTMFVRIFFEYPRFILCRSSSWKYDLLHSVTASQRDQMCRHWPQSVRAPTDRLQYCQSACQPISSSLVDYGQLAVTAFLCPLGWRTLRSPSA